jgi:hypothetical protein
MNTYSTKAHAEGTEANDCPVAYANKFDKALKASSAPGLFTGGDMNNKMHTEWCLSDSVDPISSEPYVCNCGAESASLDEIQRAIAWLGEHKRLREASTAELLAIYTTEKNAEITSLQGIAGMRR